ncbi:MAG: zinc-ribbon domain-containing protein [Candidatus Izemoplasmatales bacterium]|jgi:uncharacterized membrane protein YvbJ|nr:zinc-ribbon domain-containing protein [Candidatus Izemoplasmatales bacterium]
MAYCTNCGAQIREGAYACLNCGKIYRADPYAKNPVVYTNNNTKTLGVLSIIFGASGFWPLIFIGSITGFILALIGLKDPYAKHKKLFQIGLGLSIGSFSFYAFFLIVGIIAYL